MLLKPFLLAGRQQGAQMCLLAATSVTASLQWLQLPYIGSDCCAGGGGYGNEGGDDGNEPENGRSHKRRRTQQEQGYPRASGSISHWQAYQTTA